MTTKIFRDLFGIKEIRNKIFFSTFVIAIVKIGSLIVLPGVNFQELSQFKDEMSTGIWGVLNIYSASTLASASILGLGIGAFLSQKALISLIFTIWPLNQESFIKNDKPIGKISNQKNNAIQIRNSKKQRYKRIIERYLPIFVIVIQAPFYVIFLSNRLPSTVFDYGKNPSNFILICMILIAGSFFINWISSLNNKKGILKSSVLFMITGIISTFPSAFVAEVKLRLVSGGLIVLLLEVLVLALMFMFIILLLQGIRKVPVQQPKRLIGSKQFGGSRKDISLKVMPRNIFAISTAQVIILLAILLQRYFDIGKLNQTIDLASIEYNLILFILVFLVSFFGSAIKISPALKRINKDLSKGRYTIPGLKPGKQTVQFVDRILDRITVVGALAIAFISIVPGIAFNIGIHEQFSIFFGGVPLLIIVIGNLNALQYIDDKLLEKHYNQLK